MAGKKIGQLTPLGRNLIATDELELSLAGSAGSRKITGAQIIGAAGGVSSVTGTAPIASSGGATPAISIATANTTTTGALTSTDWNTFNNKQNKLGGENYIFVNSNGTPIENGISVLSAYAAAQAMTPNGAALSATNRVVILLAPGYYSFDEGSPTGGIFTVNSSFIDLESLSGVPDVYFSSMQVLSTGGGINVRISGIDTTKNSYLSTGPFALYTTGGVNENIYIKDCIGGDYSFGAFSSGFKGTIDTCVAGNYSFGYTADVSPVGMSFVGINPTLYGTYKNCIGGNYCFLSSQASAGGTGSVNNLGIIDNCRSGSNSFAYSIGDITLNNGTISNCVSTGTKSFCVSDSGNGVDNSGLIINCRGTGNSFAVSDNAFGLAYNSGRIIECTATGNNCFAAHVTVPNQAYNYGSIINCNANNSSNAFCGGTGTNGGWISNCIASSLAFCCNNSSGIGSDIYRCTLINDTFTVGATGGGRVVLGIDTTGVVNY